MRVRPSAPNVWAAHLEENVNLPSFQKFKWAPFTNGFQWISRESDQNHFHIYLCTHQDSLCLRCQTNVTPHCGWFDCELARMFLSELATWTNPSPPIRLFQHLHELPDASDPFISLVIQGSACCKYYHPSCLPCWLTALYAAPQGQTLDAVMGLKNQNWSREPEGTDTGTQTCRSSWKKMDLQVQGLFSGRISELKINIFAFGLSPNGNEAKPVAWSVCDCIMFLQTPMESMGSVFHKYWFSKVLGCRKKKKGVNRMFPLGQIYSKEV